MSVPKNIQIIILIQPFLWLSSPVDLSRPIFFADKYSSKQILTFAKETGLTWKKYFPESNATTVLYEMIFVYVLTTQMCDRYCQQICC